MGNHILEMLDRLISNYEWINRFLNSLVTYLPRTHSNHCPLLLQLNYHRSQPNKVIRFETIGASRLEFRTLIHSVLSTHTQLLPAIENFTTTVKSWNKTHFETFLTRKNSPCQIRMPPILYQIHHQFIFTKLRTRLN